MENNAKRYLIPVNGQLIEVSEEVYKEYYRPIWRTRKRAQLAGSCACPKSQLWKCDGECQLCSFSATGDQVSLSTPIGGDHGEISFSDRLCDDVTPETKLFRKDLIEALYSALTQLDSDSRQLCYFIMQGKTEREIAAALNLSQSTLHYKKQKTLALLRKVLQDYI